MDFLTKFQNFSYIKTEPNTYQLWRKQQRKPLNPTGDVTDP